MIDIHAHVLPHLDDGARNTATAVEMLRMAMAQGVTTVVCTPHYYGKRHSPRQFLEKRQEAFERIKPMLPQEIELRLGAEVHFTGVNMPSVEELCLLAIEGTKYVLIELPFTTVWERSLFDKLREFIEESGYTPIIAHVERYREVWKRPVLITELVEMGCLIQVNTTAFLEKRERKLAYALLKHGLVHCIGTDMHDALYRSPKMKEAQAEVEKRGYSAEWKRAQELMQEALAGGQVRVEAGKPIKKIFWKYL